MTSRQVKTWFAAAASVLLASCSFVPSVPPSAIPETAPPSWDDYGASRAREPVAWGRKAGHAARAPRAGVARAALRPLPLPGETPSAASSEAGVAGAGGAAAVHEASRKASSVTSPWADGFVEEGFREEFDRAVRRAAARGMAEAEDARGRVYAFARREGREGCAAVEVTVLSAGRSLPVLARGSAEACGR